MKLLRHFLSSLLFLAFCLSSSAIAGSARNFRYILDAQDLAPLAQQKLQSFLDETAAFIPSQMKAAIGAPIRVHFSALDAGNEIRVPCRAETEGDVGLPSKLGAESEVQKDHSLQHIYGSTRWNWPLLKPRVRDIDLHRAFIPVILAGHERAKTFACGHRDLFQLALATLIHETAHIYDFSEYRTPEEIEALEGCRNRPISTDRPSRFCERLFRREAVVSGRLGYRRLMGWEDALTGRAPKNTLLTRSPDPYEFSQVTENFAVNMEYFLLDPEYACRRPAAHHYLAEHFRVDPFPNRKCGANFQLRLSGTGLVGSIDPARIYQVHYLFASKGQEMMSRWGHAMLRFVVCAPHRNKVDENCLKDTEHHVVVSFRANVNDLVIDSVRGFFGGYPSQVFLYSLNEIVDEYTRREMRDLISLPLRLTAEEKSQLVRRTAELYWSYSGKYYFVTNNCASEAADLLRAVLSEDHDLQDASIVTPLGLYQEFIDEGLADPSVLADRVGAKKLGFYFPSNRESLESSFELIAQKGVKGFSGVDDYLSKTTAASRRAWYQSLQISASGKDRRLVAAFYLLESQMRRKLTREINNKTLSMILGENSASGASSVPAELVDLLKRFQGDELSPWSLVNSKSGYGVPLSSEVLSEAEIQERQKGFSQILNQIFSWLGERLKDENAEIAAVKDNILFFSNELKLD